MSSSEESVCQEIDSYSPVISEVFGVTIKFKRSK